jgi:hypothetical protein
MKMLLFWCAVICCNLSPLRAGEQTHIPAIPHVVIYNKMPYTALLWIIQTFNYRSSRGKISIEIESDEIWEIPAKKGSLPLSACLQAAEQGAELTACFQLVDKNGEMSDIHRYRINKPGDLYIEQDTPLCDLAE